MEERHLLALLDTIKTAEDRPSDLGPLRSFVLAYLLWEPEVLEETLGIALPNDLRWLWTETPGLVMFWDISYGQHGLMLWSPD